MFLKTVKSCNLKFSQSHHLFRRTWHFITWHVMVFGPMTLLNLLMHINEVRPRIALFYVYYLYILCWRHVKHRQSMCLLECPKTCRVLCCHVVILRFPAMCFVLHRDISQVSVLIPGAGLGRLAYEVALLGYSCQGNEVSLFMLLTSNFILNKLVLTNCYVYVSHWRVWSPS